MNKDYKSDEMLMNAAEQAAGLLTSNVRTDDYEQMENFHQKMLDQASSKGDEDGLKGFPKDEGSAQTESRIKNEYSAQFQKSTNNEWSLLTQLKTLYERIKDDFSYTLVGAKSIRIRQIEKAFTASKIRHGRLSGETDANSWLLTNLWAVYAIIIVLGCLEVPLNNTVFMAFRLSTGETLIVSFILVLAIPILAHYGGKSFKRWSLKTSMKIKAMIISLVFFVFAFSLGLFRYTFFKAQDMYNVASVENPNVLLSDLMAEVPYSEALQSSEFWVGFVFNVILLLVALILGYISHDSNPEFEKAYVNYHKNRPALIRKRDELVEKEARESKAVGQKSKYAIYFDRFSRIERLHATLYDYVLNFADYTEQLSQEAISTYRSANMKSRGSGSYPSVWDMPLQKVIRLRLPNPLSSPLKDVS